MEMLKVLFSLAYLAALSMSISNSCLKSFSSPDMCISFSEEVLILMFFDKNTASNGSRLSFNIILSEISVLWKFSFFFFHFGKSNELSDHACKSIHLISYALCPLALTVFHFYYFGICINDSQRSFKFVSGIRSL